MKHVFVVMMICMAPLSTFGMGKGETKDLPEFAEVAKGKVYRGAQPSEPGMHLLVTKNIRTVISLRNESDDQIRDEEKVIISLGMAFVSIPLSGLLSPKSEDMDRIEALLEDTKNLPVFVHCQYGKDRTGLAIGLYRVLAQKWTPKAAYEEMLDLGFHSILFGLKNYFESRTGYRGELAYE